MALDIKLDEDLPTAAAQLLRKAGHRVETVIDQGLGGAKDPRLWSIIQAENRFFVTADKGFGDIRVYPPGRHGGILLLRPYREGIGQFLSLLQLVIRQHALEDLAGTVTVVTPQRIRIRRE